MKEFLKSKKGKIIILVALIVVVGLTTTGVCIYKYIQNIKMGTYRQLDEITLDKSGNYYLSLHDGSKIQLTDGKSVYPKKIVKNAEDKNKEEPYNTFYSDVLTNEVDIRYNTKTDTLEYKILKEKDNPETSYLDLSQLLSVYMSDNYLQFKVPKTTPKHDVLYLNFKSQSVTTKAKDGKDSLKIELKPNEDDFVKVEIPEDKVELMPNLFYDLTKELKENYNFYNLYEIGQEK